jgi:dephospho-CoA kinase
MNGQKHATTDLPPPPANGTLATHLISMLIGLTGNMGCGKSTAARFFEESGFSRIDSDALVRERILTAPEVEAEAARRFGPSVLDPAGRIDRPAVARIIFSDDAKRLAWEDFILPRLYILWRELREAAPAGTRWMVEAPILHEKELEKEFDFIVCVASSTAHQYARLRGRGFSQALAGQRISKQFPLAKKIELADFVLSNDGGTDFLRDQIRHLAGLLQNRAL